MVWTKILLDIACFVGGAYLGYYTAYLRASKEWRTALIEAVERILKNDK